MGAHQKIDKVARRHLGELLPDNSLFPSGKDILYFEGKNGPDGVKRKSPARDEPWHYLEPFSHDHGDFFNDVDIHYQQLVKHLKKQNSERAAFEAAWLAHAVVDGLTPAHHYPYEAKLVALRDGRGIETRTTYKEKLFFKGETWPKTLSKTYQAYGPKGLMTTHVLFEMGITIIIRPLRFPDARPTHEAIAQVLALSPKAYFIRQAREIAVLDLYERYMRYGWTPRLSNQIRHQLAPNIIKTVTLLWYRAAKEAGICEL
jgi:hypothetical protein